MESEMNTSTTCPECGGSFVNGLSCWEQLGLVIAWEWQDPELQALHFLTVASYNLQHPAQFMDDAIDGLRQVYVEYLDHGLKVEEIRRRFGQSYAANTRVLKPEAERRPILRSWDMTIADVYLHDQPEGAAERVRSWAASIRAQL
jgi:hypothetical protein